MILLILFFVVFIVMYLQEKRRFANAVVFGIFMMLLGLSVLANLLPVISSQSEILSLIYLAFLVALVPIAIFGMTIGTFFNSKILLEKEGRRFSNLFFGLIGFGISFMIIAFVFMVLLGQAANDRILLVYVWLAMLVGYGLFLYSCVVLYATLYYFTPIFYKPDYIIALGSGLIGDKVPPLLASRVDKAVSLYYKYAAKKGVPPILVMSGGQGSDELVAEATAMRDYIVEKYGIPSEHILVEDQSVNTEQNMRFSKKIMDAHSGEREYRSVFVTNEFHLFRASLYARKAGLDAEGVGSRTAFYYVPNAFTREFIGLLEMNKKYHIIIFILVTLMMALLMRSYW